HNSRCSHKQPAQQLDQSAMEDWFAGFAFIALETAGASQV
ncbi:hypothetical protein QJQ45_027024, partial [Haematococcus lacustris]